MNISTLSSSYTVRELTKQDIDAIYRLSIANTLYYKHCPPLATKESILKDMKALPNNKTYDDKYYLGFWDNDKLIAILDLITNYPDEKTAFIGLFMLDISVQGKGVGSSIFKGISGTLKQMGYSYIRLGYALGNPQSEAFWRKNGFMNTGVKYENIGYTVVFLQKQL